MSSNGKFANEFVKGDEIRLDGAHDSLTAHFLVIDDCSPRIILGRPLLKQLTIDVGLRAFCVHAIIEIDTGVWGITFALANGLLNSHKPCPHCLSGVRTVGR